MMQYDITILPSSAADTTDTINRLSIGSVQHVAGSAMPYHKLYWYPTLHIFNLIFTGLLSSPLLSYSLTNLTNLDCCVDWSRSFILSKPQYVCMCVCMYIWSFTFNPRYTSTCMAITYIATVRINRVRLPILLS